MHAHNELHKKYLQVFISSIMLLSQKFPYDWSKWYQDCQEGELWKCLTFD